MTALEFFEKIKQDIRNRGIFDGDNGERAYKVNWEECDYILSIILPSSKRRPEDEGTLGCLIDVELIEKSFLEIKQQLSPRAFIN